MPAPVSVALFMLLAAMLAGAPRDANSRARSPAGGDETSWQFLSSRGGDLEPPGTGTQQTSSVVFDVDRDGLSDFVIAERTSAPSVVWYRRHPSGWTRGVIEPQPLRIEAGSCAADVDQDGDVDFIAGGDQSSASVWWWENPGTRADPLKAWRRWLIKSSGASKHHDLVFGDVTGDGRGELVLWNQGAGALWLAEVPVEPRADRLWRLRPIFTYRDDGQPEPRSQRPEPAWKRTNEHEGLAIADIDGDGRRDVVGGGSWFKYESPGGRWQAHPIDPTYTFTRTGVGQLVEGGRPEVVLVVGDGAGPLMYYEWVSGTWQARQLLETVQDGHSLAVVDVDGDGHLDIFVAEMRLGGGNPDSKMYLLRGDSRGHFRPTVIATGHDHHESKVVDLDGDGRLDILGKPYNFGTPSLEIWLQR